MPDSLKIILGIVIGIVCAILIFSLIVVIACSVNGLTFSEQICSWFGATTPSVEETIEQAVKQTNITIN